jgi:hypothetical protein
VKRDLRHVLWFMAVVMPVAVVLTLLTSGDLRRSSRIPPVSHAAHFAGTMEASLDRLGQPRRRSRRAELHEARKTSE